MGLKLVKQFDLQRKIILGEIYLEEHSQQKESAVPPGRDL